MSHDLREPLRNVVNFTQLLLRQYEDCSEPEAQTFASYIIEGVQRMEMLLDDLLMYSQAAGPLEESATMIDCNAIVKTAIENLKVSITESGGEITSDVLPHVLGHQAQLVQLFQNLIGNAIKYRSKEPLRVHVSARNNGAEWVFGVRDNGIGIASDYQKTIFGLFKRLHGRDIPGTGMGLAICSKVIERHGGRIWVESRRGEGAEFFFTLRVGA